jgi:hypothetical protein
MERKTFDIFIDCLPWGITKGGYLFGFFWLMLVNDYSFFFKVALTVLSVFDGF